MRYADFPSLAFPVLRNSLSSHPTVTVRFETAETFRIGRRGRGWGEREERTGAKEGR